MEHNSTLQLSHHFDGISICGIRIVYWQPSVESQLLASENMGHNKILLTLWAALRSITHKIKGH
jgi:hypothetical protein